MKRTFKKLFNRDLPLFEVQYWYRAECDVLYKMTRNTARFNPLFVYTKDRGVGVYYDGGEVDCNFDLLVDYFADNPDAFTKMTEKYANDCIALQKSIQCYTGTEGIGRLFSEISEKIFPVVSLIMTVGNLKGNTLEKESMRAQVLRKNTERILYDAGERLYALAAAISPKHKKYVSYLTIEEILENKLPTRDEIKKRMSGYIYFEDKVYSGSDIGRLERRAGISIVQDTAADTNAIVGSTASNGRVTGVVRILFTGPDMGSIEKGDILVAPMTTPDFLPAMKKASAFVTDEGGITCHAAIVAREMGKPCVIGTKIATQVLKNGDLVEVDADNAVVKVLKKKLA